MSEHDTSIEIVTLDDLRDSIKCTEEFISTMVTKKYSLDSSEKTYDDVVNRMCRVLRDRFGDNEEMYASDTVGSVLSILEGGYFIPGGSISAGLGNDKYKCSLSNCYVLSIANDSIESILDCLKEACRTYSYRGGVGIDITVLRPNNTPVGNAARTSSGAVSFIPMISQANATIGTNSRRAAMMISMDIRHPDVMEFLWCKADPEGVFHRDHMSSDVTARYLRDYLNTDPDISDETRVYLEGLVSNGRLPDINTANISIKVIDEFMNLAIDASYDEPWITMFPDIDADKDLYNEKWNGDYDIWNEVGGKLLTYDHHYAFITNRNYKRFIGRKTYNPKGNHEVLTEDLVKKYLEDNFGSWKAKLLNPTPKELLRQLAETNYIRNDPGLLFWDRVCKWTMGANVDPTLKPITTNPCSEIPGSIHPETGGGESCLLGAHVLHKYVRNPYTDKAYFDIPAFYRNVERAYLLMNMFATINEDLHPLESQKHMNRYSRRIGIEFTGLGDMLSRMGMEYGSDESVEFVKHLMHGKTQIEFGTNISLARDLGPCDACDPRTNTTGLKILFHSDFITHILNPTDEHDPSVYMKEYQDWQMVNKSIAVPHKYSPNYNSGGRDEIDITTWHDLLEYGLRNSGMNTVGPTGTLSMMADYCSSGIEPIFDLFQNRMTRVGNKSSYSICHLPIIRKVLEDMLAENKTTTTLADIRKRYHVVIANDLDYHTRIKMQSGVQLSCDSSISSTVNLPKDTTVDTIMDIYTQAYLGGLKGITIYRNGSMAGVISSAKKTKSTVSEEADTAVPSTPSKSQDTYARGEIMPLADDLPARRYEVSWEGTKIYAVVVFSETYDPVELFIASLPYEVANDTHGNFDSEDYQQKLFSWSVITRFLSIGLRAGVSAEVLISQLRKGTASITDLISVIARVLSRANEYSLSMKGKLQIPVVTSTATGSPLSECPECKQMTLLHQSGCANCINVECGWTKCM